MRIIYTHGLLISLFLTLYWLSCQPKTMTKAPGQAEVDSVLYFKQTDIRDPFLDRVASEPDQAVNVSKVIYPPPPPVPPVSPFKEIEGFRVQVFAGVDSVNALSVRYQMKDIVQDSAYFLNEKGLFKIQVGDYPYRAAADETKALLRRSGFPGAWVLRRNILIPKGPEKTEELLSPATPDSSSATKFKIQVLVTSSEENARQIAADLKQIREYGAFYLGEENVYKVFVGYYTDEQKARKVLDDIRQLGYPDAWLVY